MSSTFVRIGRFILDVSLSEDHKFESDITDFPVESGGSISDNIRPKPIQVTITGIVTDTPLGSNASSKPIVLPNPIGAATAFVASLTASTTDLENPNAVAFLPSEQAYLYLKSIYDARDTVTIRTSLGTFDNMALESLSIPRSKDTTGGLTFTADFKQIRRVTNQRLKTAIRNGNGKKSRGPKPTKGREGQILWQQADPAGSYNIYAKYWVAHQPMKDFNYGGGTGWFYRSGSRSVEEGGLATTTVFNPGTAFQTTILGAGLTEMELRRFTRDWERDKIDAERAVAGTGNDTLSRGTGPVKPSPIDIRDTPYLAKQPKADLSDKARLGMVGEKPTYATDPSFHNKGNFLDSNPAPSASDIPGFKK